ncbi:Hypothetical protein PHPALM_740 [Phytophthora palmivora]|uniref:CCHC-type domain-containing protein n=1 Tax=Phytophthora palmivora TaxID=4796 RepID=A0A2P4YU39_9STRA|nr:Hypothetical protein PHPALM_740 [Phytophthora palmivora]
MFHPGRYDEETIERLKTVCEQDTRGTQLREGTDDEWMIVTGLVEGTITCRKFPSFMAQLMRTEERLRILGTIQAQVEGHLWFSLKNEDPVPIAIRTTNGLLETIMTAAEARQTASALSEMLRVVKTASYDAVTNSVHLYFFTRGSAAKYGGWKVPFRKDTHVLHNMHVAPRGAENVWTRQDEPLIGANAVARTYTIKLINVSRFLVGSMLTSKQSSPSQCLACGDVGHFVRQCRKTPRELHGRDCLTVTEQDIRSRQVEPATFTSMAELKATIKAKLAAAIPLPEEGAKSRTVQKNHSKPEDQQWRTKVSRKTSSKQPVSSEEAKTETDEPPTPLQGLSADSNRYRHLQEVEETKPNQHEQAETETSDSAGYIIDLRSSADSNRGDLTEAEAPSPRDLKGPTPSELLLIKQEAQTQLETFEYRHPDRDLFIIPTSVMRDKEDVSKLTEREIETRLQLRSLNTPATGNCQAYAILQAYVAAPTRIRGSTAAHTTAALKRGIRAVALTDFEAKYTHEDRKATLHALNRGYTGMSRPNAAAEFKRYLEDYAASNSDAESVVPPENGAVMIRWAQQVHSCKRISTYSEHRKPMQLGHACTIHRLNVSGNESSTKETKKTRYRCWNA